MENLSQTTLFIISVSLRCAQRNENRTRIYDKKQACYYCGKLLTKVARHYEQKHESEREVAIALSFNKGSPNRKKHLEKLRLLGNYHHNMTVLKVGKGELIVSRRPSTTERCNPNDFFPCEHCLGFIRRQKLFKHVKSCKFKSENFETPKYQEVQEKSKLLLSQVESLTCWICLKEFSSEACVIQHYNEHMILRWHLHVTIILMCK